jgi:hypothetical protein
VASSSVDPASDAPVDSAPAASWFEFNDAIVRPFSVDDIPTSAFGGMEKVEQFDRTTNATVTKEVLNIRSAYMLVYKRRYTPPEATEPAMSTSTTDSLVSSSVAASSSSSSCSSRSPSGVSPSSLTASGSQPPGGGALWSFDRHRADVAYFPASIRDAVWRDNIAFLNDKYTFDGTLSWFVWNLVRLHLPGDRTSQVAPASQMAVTTAMRGDAPWSTPNAVAIAQLAVHFTFDILARNADNAAFPQWMDLLYRLFEWDAGARRWFLGSLIQERPGASGQPSRLEASKFFHHLVFECPQQIVREAFGDLIVFVVAEAREDEAERALYWTEAEETPGKLAVEQEEAKADATGVPVADPPAVPKGADADLSSVPPPSSLGASSRSVSPARFSTLESASDGATSSPPHRAPRSPITRLFQWFLDTIPSVRQHHRTYKEFWRALYHLARIGADERRWLVQHEAIRIVTAFYLDANPLTGFNVTAAYAGDPPKRKHVTSSFWVLQLVALLIRSWSDSTVATDG